ncbi:MAG: UDP-N-acetylglucosamine 1-carboxyvinyltransferase, partial [Proteobacteria bacterium]|nr:UDP-N-acetylglucosamine 1-carboxyvinyltransferase [Pseudomonadota bacterium]
MALDKIRIHGSNKPLQGEIQISGSKNAALPLLALTVLGNKPCTIHNVPHLEDINNMIRILEHMGAKVKREGTTITVDAETLTSHEAPYDIVRKMRASVVFMGPLLAKYGEAKVSLPGGCAIGVRPIDLHLKAFEALGASIQIEEGYVLAKGSKLKGIKIFFDKITVTGTMNAMMAAAQAEGETILQNCAKEPELICFAEAMRRMGVQVSGDGTDTITIQGTQNIGGFEIDNISDRIETGTYMIAAAITGGELYLKNTDPAFLESVIAKLKQTGSAVEEEKNGIWVRAGKKILPCNIETQPHPGFPTDMQAQFVAMLCLAESKSVVSETIFENRFMHV